MRRASEPLLPLGALRLPGRHNAANALAALAIGSVAGFPRAAMTDVLRSFPGLPHRAERVREWRGIAWIDDSKGTNVGATVAAIEGLDGPLVLIAGGEGKGQDFAPLAAACTRQGAGTRVLIGRDAPHDRRRAQEEPRACRSPTRWNRPSRSRLRSRGPADTVLLSPACASFDMFRDYAHRGEVFAAAVRELPQ